MTTRPAPRSKRCYRLRGSVGSRERWFILSPGDHSIGSSEDNDLILAISGVSRSHARISHDGAGNLELEDLGSRNGTFINGRRLAGGRVRAGDEVRFGPVALRLEEIDSGDAELALVLADPDSGRGSLRPPSQTTATLGPRPAVAPPPGARTDLAFAPGYVAGASPVMERFHQKLEPLLEADLPVLIEGETGVGKELVARTLHLSSKRADGPFVAVNCAAIPSDLLEAEMFGIGEGVATGVKKRAGKIRAAEGGTLLLDEVGEMPKQLQAKLLRALQEKEIQPLGTAAVEVDVWVVAATNVDLELRVEQGDFRRDLYYRLAGVVLAVPPLRARPEDVPLLVEHYLRETAKASGKAIRGVTAKAMDVLGAYPWPGNVRELANEVRRLAHLAGDGQAIESEMLAPRLREPSGEGMAAAAGSLRLRDRVAATERRVISEALERAGGSRRQAARLLGIARSTLARKLRELGLPGREYGS